MRIKDVEGKSIEKRKDVQKKTEKLKNMPVLRRNEFCLVSFLP